MTARRRRTRQQVAKGRQSVETVVPLTAREKRQVEAQLKLARAEVARLQALKSGYKVKVPSDQKPKTKNQKPVFAPIVPTAQRKRVAQLVSVARKRIAAPKNAATLRQVKKLEAELRELQLVRDNLEEEIESYRSEASLKFEKEPQRDVRTILPMAKKREYVENPVSNVHVNKKGWIVGNTADSLGNPIPVRCWVVYNSENKKFNVRWMLWFKESNLPKRGVTDTDEKYEDLSPQKYYVYGIFNDSKRVEQMRSEMLNAAEELESELQGVLQKIDDIEQELSRLRRTIV